MMTEEWFLKWYYRLKSLERAVGEIPEIEELVEEAKADGLDPDKLLEEHANPRTRRTRR